MKIYGLYLCGLAISASAHVINKRASLPLKIDFVKGNCQIAMVSGENICTEVPERTDPYCYMFQETPGGKWCMRVDDKQSTGPYFRFG